MQQFQDDIMKNRLLTEQLFKQLSERIENLENRVHSLEDFIKSGQHDK